MWVDWNYHCVDHPQTTPDNSWGAFAYGNSNILGWILLSEFKSWIINKIFRSLAVSLSYDSRPTIQLQYSSGPLSLICITPQNYPILLTKLEIFYQVDNLHLPPPYLLGGAGGGVRPPRHIYCQNSTDQFHGPAAPFSTVQLSILWLSRF